MVQVGVIGGGARKTVSSAALAPKPGQQPVVVSLGASVVIAKWEPGTAVVELLNNAGAPTSYVLAWATPEELARGAFLVSNLETLLRSGRQVIEGIRRLIKG